MSSTSRPPERGEALREEYAGQVAPERGARVHVARRIQIALERAHRLGERSGLQRSTSQSRLRAGGAHGYGADAAESETRLADHAVVHPAVRGEAHEGIVAVAAGQLGEARAPARTRHRYRHRRHDLALAQIGGIDAVEKARDGDLARASRTGNAHHGVEGEETRGQLGGRI